MAQSVNDFLLPSEKNDVLTRLGAGDFFGEIGILNIDGANRRTADVRSVGYSELFSLSKEDVLEGCRDYPEAERKLYEYAQNRLGFEKAKKEAAEKMKGALSTLTSIASCLTHNPIATAPVPGNVVANNDASKLTLETEDVESKAIEPTSVCLYNRRVTIGNRSRTKPKNSIVDTQNSNCDNQEKPLLSQYSLFEHQPLSSLQLRSNDLMSNIQWLINDKLASVENNYRDKLAELQDQNERKDLRIKLLEQKIQKLQKTLLNRNRIWFEDD